MNKVDPPGLLFEIGALHDLCHDKRLGSYPSLVRAWKSIARAYVRYASSEGNAALIPRLPLGRSRASFLRAHFKSKPKAVAHLAKILSPSVGLSCPMCGSLHVSTLDHVFPKEDFPEFSVFALNLVPACNCNSARGRMLVGAVAGERILHPYFDACLSRRLVVAKFSNLGELPDVSIQPCIPSADPDYHAIAYHVSFVASRTKITEWLRSQWSNMLLNPPLAIRALERFPATNAGLVDLLEKERALLEAQYRGCNSWPAIFVSGLLDPEVVAWMMTNLPSRVSALRSG